MAHSKSDTTYRKAIINYSKKIEKARALLKNPENYSNTTITPEEAADLQNNEEFAEEIGNNLKLSKVTDRNVIDKIQKEFDAGEYITTYRAMWLGPDGKLHSPMASYIDDDLGPAIEIGALEQADERPDPEVLQNNSKDDFFSKIKRGTKKWRLAFFRYPPF